MEVNMYSLYDTKAKAFLQPFFTANTDLALRMVETSMNEGKQVFCKHPEDFSLWFVATFDDLTGQMDTDGKPVLVTQLITLNNGASQLELAPESALQGGK